MTNMPWLVTRWVTFTRWVTISIKLIIPIGTMIHDAVAAPGQSGSGVEGVGEGRRGMGHGYGGITNNFLFFQIIQ